MKNPILTFSSGPTNSMRGAVFLSGRTDALVIDIGGTTTDIGMVCNGFPREASSQVKVCVLCHQIIILINNKLFFSRLVEFELISRCPMF